MALKKNFTTTHGIDLENAYIRIDEQSGSKEVVNLRIRTYVDKEKFNAGFSWIAESIRIFTPSVKDGAENFIKQGYEYLKTLQEYADASDVIE